MPVKANEKPRELSIISSFLQKVIDECPCAEFKSKAMKKWKLLSSLISAEEENIEKINRVLAYSIEDSINEISFEMQMMEEKNHHFNNFSAIEMNSCQLENPRNNLSSIFEGNSHDSFTSCIEEMNNFVLDENDATPVNFSEKIRHFKSTIARHSSNESNLCLSGDYSLKRFMASILHKKKGNTSLVSNLEDYSGLNEERRN